MQKLPLVLSATALAVAVLGSTPLVAVAQNAVFPPGSVGSSQLKAGAVTSPKIARNAVGSTHVQNGSLLAADFKRGQLPAGPKGDAGGRGDKGDKGDRGESGATNVIVRQGPQVIPPVNGAVNTSAECNPGERAVGGGAGSTLGGGSGETILTGSTPRPITGTPTGWQVGVSATSPNLVVRAYVICSSP